MYEYELQCENLYKSVSMNKYRDQVQRTSTMSTSSTFKCNKLSPCTSMSSSTRTSMYNYVHVRERRASTTSTVSRYKDKEPCPCTDTKSKYREHFIQERV